ncbi:MAG: hypothetical protein OXI15_01600 [Chromatiales bacterium]|nr:hypothetical protein [Chromatiales bacterium]
MTKPSDTGPAPPQSGPLRSDREATPNQLDLFAERGRMMARRVPEPMAPPAAAPMETLSDDNLLESIEKAGPSSIEALCSEVVSRSLEVAVPALEALWRRFAGFGVEKPLREQLAVLETLARLAGADARSALRAIVLSKGLPASLLPAASQAAASAGLALPAAFVGPLLDHEDAAVRGAAFVLAARTDVSTDRLREGLFDRSAANRRAAAVALGLRGDASARQPLYDELARYPSTEVIEAITAVWDDDAIVHLGRCARRHPRLAGAVVDALRDIASPRAHTVARNLETSTGRTTPDGQ